jgi:UDP-glucose 4-epimerase
MQFVHEHDVINAFALSVDNDFPGEFNIIGDGVLPYSTILAMMGKVPLPLPHFVAYSLSRALWATQIFDSPPHFLDFLRFLCVADGDKARRVMGFEPKFDIKQTIHEFLGVAPPLPQARDVAPTVATAATGGV